MSEDNEIVVTDGWANKYRPKSLDKYRGQEAAVSLVKGFMKKGFPQVLMITGPTGTGKTTLARIIAAEINGCKDPDKNEDLSDFNIADMRGIDDIRQIAKSVGFLPRRRFRVILLDEVHALTKQAASAVLKPLEEPPKHLIWILCTNEPEKMLSTVLGRATPIRLAPATPKTVLPLLKYICKKEDVDFGSKHKRILRKIAETTGGQPRSSVGLLQAAAALVAGGTNASESLKLAIQQLASHQSEKVAIKMLLGCYFDKPNMILSALADVEDHEAIINISLELNRYLFDLSCATQRTYHSYNRRELVSLIKEKTGKVPGLKKVATVHRALTSCKTTMNLYSVKGYHVLASILTDMAVKEAKE